MWTREKLLLMEERREHDEGVDDTLWRFFCLDHNSGRSVDDLSNITEETLAKRRSIGGIVSKDQASVDEVAALFLCLFILFSMSFLKGVAQVHG